MLIMQYQMKLWELKDIISGISIKHYSVQLRIHLMLWNIEYVVKNKEEQPPNRTIKHSSHSLKSMSNYSTMMLD